MMALGKLLLFLCFLATMSTGFSRQELSHRPDTDADLKVEFISTISTTR